MDIPPRIPEKNPIMIDNIFSYLGLRLFRFNPKKLINVKTIIVNAIIIEFFLNPDLILIFHQ